MMPILDQSPGHHHHGHGHQVFYHQQPVPEQAGKMQLTLILPNGVPSVINVDANTPMMDLLVQAASLNKLSPSGHSLVVLDSNQHMIHFKPNQTVGQIVRGCQLPQVNGSSTISLLPKEISQSHPSSKKKAQPFEITVRLQVNLPDAQKILLRVDPTLPLHEIKEQICKQKRYVDSNRYTLRLPHKLDEPLLLGLSLAEYKTNEITLVRLKHDSTTTTNQIQSFDRLYRTRSESQPPRDLMQEVQQEHQELINSKHRPASVQLNPLQGQNTSSFPTRPTHPKTSHTSLHAYWNDPNFDTQSQTSNCSSTTKKRQAPRPPDHVSPTLNEQSQQLEHHQSQESLTESLNGTKHKRKAPISPHTTTSQEEEANGDQQVKTDNESQPHTDEQHIECVRVQESTSSITQTQEQIHSELQSSSTPIYSQIQKTKEGTPNEPHYSTVKSSPTQPVPPREDHAKTTPSNYGVEEIVQAGIAERPTRSASKPSKKTKSTDGLTKIITDHNERAQIYQANEKQAENVSYFRVAKSRHGKFETDNQGFVNTTSNVFDSTTDQKQIQNTDENDQSQILDAEQLAVLLNSNEKPPTPIQLEVTQRTTHISVTVESDRKQIITRASPVPQQSSSTPPAVAPKPSGKTITEYRTVRRIGQDGETTTTTTVRTETVPSELTDNVDQTTSLTPDQSSQQPHDMDNSNKQ
ncbi:unnamed protein product [Adineta ricciae]|uniref:Cordon-bleu ubiquitin-like domain-containing protein n=1 Tax=Adineta ricciae TaxID=249248 RepID=A0A815HZE5_ADIRI|nr:unnamed protein product [Adineta ricciae]CAF1358473.1 unnamed protein product [Adineta ricciae]